MAPTSRGRAPASIAAPTAAPDPGQPAASETAGLSPREVRRLQRIKVGREQILDAAEELFGRQGYRGTSLQQVAKRCEFSIGALYLFIDNKEELLRAVLQRRTAALMQKMRDCIAGEGRAHAVLLRLARTQIDFHRRHPDFGRLSIQIMGAGGVDAAPHVNESVARGYELAIDMEADLFRRGQVDGSIRAGDPRCLARLYSAMVAVYHTMDPAVVDGRNSLDDADFLASVGQAFAPAPPPAG
jgi:AcrR family transcriptional regulator